MASLTLEHNCLGFEVHDGDQLVTLCRVREEIQREESPKPCFAPINTPSGALITEYRPKDHLWHTGLYYGWVHVNDTNLWGGPWYIQEEEGGEGKYVLEEGTHGMQRHDSFESEQVDEDGISITEKVTWLDSSNRSMVEETRRIQMRKLSDPTGYAWRIESDLTPAVDTVHMGASKAARYSGLELRMGPPFADAFQRDSEGRREHENIMGQRARWVCAVGAAGGAVVMMDHPSNPRHPVTWFARKNLLGAGLLMPGPIDLKKGDALALKYGFYILDADPTDAQVEGLFARFSAG